MEYFVVSFLKRRDLSARLEYISYHDQLTGALNRTAYKEKEKSFRVFDSAGVVYGDITGLKRVNDQFGHLAGDNLICRCYGMFCQVFGEELIYRTGGDEFLVLCTDISKEEFFNKCRKLREIIDKADCNMAIGFAWGRFGETNLQTMINQAEEQMYEEKKNFYAGWNLMAGSNHGGRRVEREIRSIYAEHTGLVQNIHQFLRKNPDSIELLIQAVSSQSSSVCLYIGDMRTNTFYISDNMRELFGFESNVVEDLPTKWERRICYPEDLELYREDIRNLLKRKREEHDFKYRVYDKDGKLLWIHCRGSLYWDEEKGFPRYFTGCISRQEFLIDPVTSFPRENDAVAKLKEIQKKNQNTVILGIGLNHFAEINETKGRGVTDNLLRDITQYWENKLSHKIWFYRLDGVRFMGIVHPDYAGKAEDFIGEIRESVRNLCHKYHVLVKYPCSICVFRYPCDIEEPDVVVEKVVTFIEVSKSNIDREYIAYSAHEEDTFRSQAEFILHLNEDVLNDFQNFRIVIQPIVSAGMGSVTGGEVLLRWKCLGQDISPAVFVPLLEKKGLICQVGRWVFEQAVRHCRRIAADYPEFHLSFNVSYLQISDEGFIDFMERTLTKYGVDGTNLIMELTESHFDDEPEKLMKFVEDCKNLGMSIALDDFGQGYSSLGLLLKYPANLVKLDRSLLTELTDSKDKQKFLKTLVYACHEFGKKVCVEGVETKAAAEIIKETEGDMIQGFYFYHPLELGDFYETLHKE
ncbi:MAG: EAL domain-containing protein [Eubacteriales bacterium]|nr:EAL domain-containing protein [Eubacteriales bacterium]